jgi:hypothetical protein
MAVITKTTQTAVLTALGAAALPTDGVSELNYQQADYTKDFTKHQVWINMYRVDRERILKNLHRNKEIFRIVIVYSGRVVGKTVANVSLGTLSTAYFSGVMTLLNADANLSNLARVVTVSSIMTDGGVLAGSANPKAVAVCDCQVEYYTED